MLIKGKGSGKTSKIRLEDRIIFDKREKTLTVVRKREQLYWEDGDNKLYIDVDVSKIEYIAQQILDIICSAINLDQHPIPGKSDNYLVWEIVERGE